MEHKQKTLYSNNYTLKKGLKNIIEIQRGNSKKRKRVSQSGCWRKERKIDGQFKVVYISLDGEKYTGISAKEQCKIDTEYLEKRKCYSSDSSGKTISKSNLEKSNLLFWGIPQSVAMIYHDIGIKFLFDWQVECLNLPGLFDQNSIDLIYSAPTSGGKTIISEILIIYRLIYSGKKAMIILPYVSMVLEKYEDLKAKLAPLSLLARCYYSSKGGEPFPPEIDLAICTIERANGLINTLITEKRIYQIGIVVFDEVHLVSDPHRGYLIELIITKLKYLSCFGNKPQIVALSATCPNLKDISNWLKSTFYSTITRPIPLFEYIKVGSSLYSKDFIFQRNVSPSPLPKEDKSQIISLCEEVIKSKKSVLIFCESRKWCESCARLITKGFSKFYPELTSSKKDKLASIISELRSLRMDICPILAKSVPQSVAYHHAGLSTEERSIIEQGFRSGYLKILVATSTLAAGVNLPARRVIFRTPKICGELIDRTRYSQMSGRAGRTGIDDYGESIIISESNNINSNKVKILTTMISSKLPNLKSSFDNTTISRLLLEGISGGIACTDVEMFSLFDCSLYSSSIDNFKEKSKLVEQSKLYLLSKNLIEYNDINKQYGPTLLGMAIFSSNLDISDGLTVFKDLNIARRNGLLLSNPIQILFLLTPLYSCHDIYIKWHQFWKCIQSLREHEQSIMQILENIGIEENFIESKLCASNTKDIPLVYRRCYIALILSELLAEKPISNISEKYGIERGKVQELQVHSSSFAGMIASFCARLNWHTLSLIASYYKEKLDFGAKDELIPLLRIPKLMTHQARALYMAGFTNIENVAASSIEKISEALEHFSPYSHRIDENHKSDIKYAAVRIYQHARSLLFEDIMMLRLQEVDILDNDSNVDNLNQDSSSTEEMD